MEENNQSLIKPGDVEPKLEVGFYVVFHVLTSAPLVVSDLSRSTTVRRHSTDERPRAGGVDALPAGPGGASTAPAETRSCGKDGKGWSSDGLYFDACGNLGCLLQGSLRFQVCWQVHTGV